MCYFYTIKNNKFLGGMAGD
ncbi:MAG: stage V sporulation protein M [Firmicutes bacterium]|nr:stage V sporulation protein M [Bacillota bacterium]